MFPAAGQPDDARRAVERGLAAQRVTGERYVDAELHRVRAVVVLALGGPGAVDEAEHALRRALAIARRQRAAAWELRAAIALAQLRGERADEAGARRVLARALTRLPERYETPDVTRAEDLLRLLS